VDWIVVAQDRDRRRALLKAVVYVWVAYIAGNFSAENLIACQEGLWSMESVSQTSR
jgi:hypothetical protein